MLGIITNGLKMFLPFSSSQQLGEELVVNGDFAISSGAGVGWNISATSPASVTISGGKFTIVSPSGESAQANQIILEANKKYTATVDVVVRSGNCKLQFGTGTGAQSFVISSTGTYTITKNIPNTLSDGRLYLSRNGACDVDFDNISVKEVGQFSLDETTNNNNAKLFTGTCLNFDGVNDYVDIGDTNTNTNTIAITFVLNSEITHLTAGVCLANLTGTGFQGIFLGAFTGTLTNELISIVGGSNVKNSYETTTDKISAGAHRLVMTYNSTSSNYDIYLDGVQKILTTSSSMSIIPANNLLLGRRGDGVAHWFFGKLSDVQLWNAAWSATDVANDYANPNQLVSSVPKVNLIANWALSEGSGAIAFDSVGLGAEEITNGDFSAARPELVTNGNFANGTTGWSAVNSTISIEDGALKITSTGGNRPQSNQTVSGLVVGQQYKLSAVAKRGTTSNDVEIEISGIASTTTSNKNSTTVFETIFYIFTATSTSHIIQAKIDEGNEPSGTTAYFDNVSVKALVPSWSDVSETGGSIAVENGFLELTTGDSNSKEGWAQQVLTLKSGRTYEAKVTNIGRLAMQVGISNKGFQNFYKDFVNDDTHTVSFTTTTNTVYLNFRNFHNINATSKLTNVSVREQTDGSGQAYNGSSVGATWATTQSTIPQLGMKDWSKGSNLLVNSNDFDTTAWTESDVSVSSVEIAPDGNPTAFKVTKTGGSGQGMLFVTGQTSNTGIRSVYARTVSGTGTVHLTSHYSNTNNLFTLTTEWQRFSAINTAVPANFYAVDFRGSSTLTEVILWGAQIDSGTTLGSFIQTKGLAVTDGILVENPNNVGFDMFGNTLRNRLNSLNLTGTGYARVADSASINPTSAITIQCWIFSNTETGKGIVAKWTQGGLKDYMLYKLTDSFNLYIGANLRGSGVIPTTGWVNIAGRYDGSTMKTFINGVESTSSSLTGSIPNNTNVLEIGRFSGGIGTYSERIDDVKLYDRALTADEILQNYKAGLSAHTN